jgi:hypothetical protein
MSRLYPRRQHLYWVSQEKGAYTLYLDGNSVVSQFELLQGATSDTKAFEIGADGVMTFLGLFPDDIKRLRVTPPSDSSIDTMLAVGK